MLSYETEFCAQVTIRLPLFRVAAEALGRQHRKFGANFELHELMLHASECSKDQPGDSLKYRAALSTKALEVRQPQFVWNVQFWTKINDLESDCFGGRLELARLSDKWCQLIRSTEIFCSWLEGRKGSGLCSGPGQHCG